MYNFLYLIQDNCDIGSNIYKIGKTTQDPSDRFKGYSKGTYPIRISQVDNCHLREIELINIFKKNYKLSRGREYFCGILNNMIIDFTNLCNSQTNNIITKSNNILTKSNITLRCSKCKQIFTTNFSLERHTNKKVPCTFITKYQCKICSKYFKRNESLKEHTIKNSCKIIFKNINEHLNISNIHVKSTNIENNIYTILISKTEVVDKIASLKVIGIDDSDNALNKIVLVDLPIDLKIRMLKNSIKTPTDKVSSI
jgi:hypothetical protein